MQEQEVENSDSQMEETVEVVEETTEAAPAQEAGETKEEFTEREKQYYERIKKLEAENKSLKEQGSATEHTGLSFKDSLYLAKADIADEDIDDVLTYAEKMGVSVREAHEHYKPILADRAEERRTAKATETKSPRGVAQKTGEDYLKKAESTGELPESDDAIRALAQARLERRRNR